MLSRGEQRPHYTHANVKLPPNTDGFKTVKTKVTASASDC